jgi:hypothetical protein
MSGVFTESRIKAPIANRPPLLTPHRQFDIKNRFMDRLYPTRMSVFRHTTNAFNIALI